MIRILFYGGSNHLTEMVWQKDPEPVINMPVYDRDLIFDYFNPTALNPKYIKCKIEQYYMMRQIRLKNDDDLYFYISEQIYGRI